MAEAEQVSKARVMVVAKAAKAAEAAKAAKAAKKADREPIGSQPTISCV